MYYTIYVTINKINGKFYIGMHRTENLNDDYLGSGILLDKAREKYGNSSFVKLISECKTEQEMIDKEKSIVTKDFLEQWKGITYNMVEGGVGGFNFIKGSKEYNDWQTNRNISLKTKKKKEMVWIKNLQTREMKFVKYEERQSYLNEGWKKGKIYPNERYRHKNYRGNRGKLHPQQMADESPEKIKWKEKTLSSLPQNQPKDSIAYKNWEIQHLDAVEKRVKKMLGKLWIKNELLQESKFINPNELDNYISLGWIKGRIKRTAQKTGRC